MVAPPRVCPRPPPRPAPRPGRWCVSAALGSSHECVRDTRALSPRPTPEPPRPRPRRTAQPSGREEEEKIESAPAARPNSAAPVVDGAVRRRRCAAGSADTLWYPPEIRGSDWVWERVCLLCPRKNTISQQIFTFYIWDPLLFSRHLSIGAIVSGSCEEEAGRGRWRFHGDATARRRNRRAPHGRMAEPNPASLAFPSNLWPSRANHRPPLSERRVRRPLRASDAPPTLLGLSAGFFVDPSVQGCRRVGGLRSACSFGLHRPFR
jgi:hypothetical protein